MSANSPFNFSFLNVYFIIYALSDTGDLSRALLEAQRRVRFRHYTVGGVHPAGRVRGPQRRTDHLQGSTCALHSGVVCVETGRLVVPHRSLVHYTNLLINHFLLLP